MQGRAIIGRLADAWRALGSDRRVAALTSLGLFVTMLLPWYSKTDTVVVRNAAHATEQSLSAFQAFSFVEAAVLLVSAGVLALLFARAEEREFHVPGGDGTIVMVAGAWAAILIFYRLLDKPGLQGNEKVTSAVGVQWGIFVALLVALGLSYVGKRIRAAEHEEPPLMRSGEDRPPGAEPRRPPQTAADPDFYEDRGSRRARAEGEQPTDATRPVPARRPSEQLPAMGGEETEPTPQRRARPRFPPAPSSGSGQMSFEDTPPGEE